MSYEISKDKLKDFRKKVFLIYDVPKYFEIDNSIEVENIKSIKINQYPGFLINLENYSDFNDYFRATFSKRSIQKLNRYNKRLENCFNLTEKMLWGSDTDKLEYDFVFKHFHKLLTKRFEDKQITNNNLNPEEWSFYKDVAYPLLLENKAGLYVIYSDDIPISVRLLYFSEDIIFDAITVFDIDYTKFHLGKLSIMKMLQWSFKENYKIFDFSKGYFDYKESWSDLKYNFEYHIHYDRNSISSFLLANSLSVFFNLKQYLRDKELNKKLHKFSFFLRKKKSKSLSPQLIITEELITYDEDALAQVSLQDRKYSFLKKHAFDFLFLNSEHLKNLAVFEITSQSNTSYLLKGENNSQTLAVK
ncbi:GNAT family N-acetyltransferase [uncultured Algibacter sp.]|uniref:GNAT family N-acetyltransferase n=1 Tax=uncultured Algibacter sp. TaxID=298659 RepID=UPI00260E4421|nr:GNAT family N-acetyltransferase [uncultured Algibacter sp.]